MKYVKDELNTSISKRTHTHMHTDKFSHLLIHRELTLALLFTENRKK